VTNRIAQVTKKQIFCMELLSSSNWIIYESNCIRCSVRTDHKIRQHAMIRDFFSYWKPYQAQRPDWQLQPNHAQLIAWWQLVCRWQREELGRGEWSAPI